MKALSLGDLSVCAENAGIRLQGKGFSMGFGTDAALGIVLTEWTNGEGAFPVSYLREKQRLMPFDLAPKAEAEAQSTDAPVNAIVQKEAEAVKSTDIWQSEGASVQLAPFGGVETVSFSLGVQNEKGVRVTLSGTAFPDCSVVRMHFTVQNGNAAASFAIAPFGWVLAPEDKLSVYRMMWFKGTLPKQDFGQMFSQTFGSRNDPIFLRSVMNQQYAPMTVLMRENAPKDGVFIKMDYAAPWSLCVEKPDGTLHGTFRIEEPDGALQLAPQETAELPEITLAFFADDMDNMMVHLYDWQYKFLWDYTSTDYFAKARDFSEKNWVYCSRVLHEQYAYRLLSMDMFGLRSLLSAGVEVEWDDAGWSAYPGWPPDNYGSVFKNNYEGPDHRLSTRYFEKLGIGRLIWFAGKVSQPLLETKHGAWGDFEWRTDGLGNTSLAQERAFKQMIAGYLDKDAKRSFHTCSGGANYALDFDIQRYANYHYAADLGAGPNDQYYYSYAFLPDKWGNSLYSLCGQNLLADATPNGTVSKDFDVTAYSPEFARGRLATNPTGVGPCTMRNAPLIREDLEIYRYLLAQGVAGRWSYLFHPGVYNDNPIYYAQRTSHDRTRACIILRHTPKGRVRVFPKGLLPQTAYTLSFQLRSETETKTGADWMADGILLTEIADREVIYLNLPDAPGHCAAKPAVIGKVLKQAENNMGVSGVGIYWCPVADDARVRYYEIAKNGKIIGDVAKEAYFFDWSAGATDEDEYAVRAVDAASVPGAFTVAERLSGGAPVVSSLGGHGEEMSKDGWTAETSTDLKNFVPMHWVPAARIPFADFGGTPNQDGGIEGYWQGDAPCAKVGRGWHQAAPEVYSVRTYTVQKDGAAVLSGRAMKEWYHSEFGSPVEIRVLYNGTDLISPTVLQCGDPDGCSYSVPLQVKKGDILRFAVGPCTGETTPVHYEQQANIIGWVTMLTYASEDAAEASESLRISCGSASDRFFTGGTATGDARVASVGEAVVYELPAPNGLYMLRLTFRETEYRNVADRLMKITVNGRVLDGEVDILHDVRGHEPILSKTYRYLVPNAEGKIQVSFTASVGGVTVSGIELAPECAETVRINVGGDDFVDWAGYLWQADTFCSDGETVYTKRSDLAQAAPTLYDKPLYFSGRAAKKMRYTVPTKKAFCTVQLKFAELEELAPGERPLDIFLNGVCVKENWDAREAVGSQFPMAANLRFRDIAAVNGAVTVEIVAKGTLPAILRAIELD